MTKTTIFIITIFIVLLISSGYAYWKSTAAINKVHIYMNKVDLSLYAHRGVVVLEPSNKTAITGGAIARIDKRFREGKRLVALAHYQNLLQEDPNNMELLLRIGLIYLQEKEYSLAQENLDLVYGFKESVFALDAAWFLALLNAEYGNWNRTKQLLKEVIDERGNYHLSAQDLWTDLEA
ncbi:tetratricopeptide repeat protein [Aureispira anguillae]|uniref:Tetratricopeptide repeat-containing protein n=1 Tax=Aureispira anguillae TaxID=2864201 RepID=A0A916DV45_9BACT|nr:hypothetical protein [Aureispira anguillae]BDS13347.1 hypothetical protein AsAng_0040840 [Aureispira anguillae]